MLAELDSSDFVKKKKMCELLEYRCTPNTTELITDKKMNEYSNIICGVYRQILLKCRRLQFIYFNLVECPCLKGDKNYSLNENIEEKIRDEIKSKKIRKSSDYMGSQKIFY